MVNLISLCLLKEFETRQNQEKCKSDFETNEHLIHCVISL